MKKWIGKHLIEIVRVINIAINFIFLGTAVSLMLDERYEEACDWFVKAIICFIIDFALVMYNKFVDRLPEEE